MEVIIHHSDSYAANLVPSMIEMGIDVWQGVMNTNDIPGMIEKYGKDITFMGGIDSASVDYEGWTREEIAKQVKRTCDENGPMQCALHGVEIMGRDVSVVAGHPALDGVQMRAITSSARKLDDEAKTVRFRLDPEKVLLFSKADEKRIPCVLK